MSQATMNQPEWILNRMRAEQQLNPVHIVECPDPRGAQLLALFNQCDERGKVTALRMLAAMPKGPL